MKNNNVALLIVDVDAQSLGKLVFTRQEKFPLAVRCFADHLWSAFNIPAMIITTGDEKDIYAGHMMRDAAQKERAVKKYGLHAVSPESHDSIFFKYGNDAFSQTILPRYLSSRHITKLIIAGMNTGACIAETTLGAMRNGFTVDAVCDLLADGNSPRKENQTGSNDLASWHSARLRESLSMDIASRHGTKYEDVANDWVNYTTAQAVMNGLVMGNPNPKRPRRLFPDSRVFTPTPQ